MPGNPGADDVNLRMCVDFRGAVGLAVGESSHIIRPRMCFLTLWQVWCKTPWEGGSEDRRTLTIRESDRDGTGKRHTQIGCYGLLNGK